MEQTMVPAAGETNRTDLTTVDTNESMTQWSVRPRQRPTHTEIEQTLTVPPHQHTQPDKPAGRAETFDEPGVNDFGTLTQRLH